MTPGKCPKCGADKIATSMSDAMWACATRLYGAGFGLPEQLEQSPPCIKRQRDQLAARVKDLEAINSKLHDDRRNAQEAGDSSMLYVEGLNRQITALREHVKRLEEVGDYWIPRDSDAQEAWAKAKGAKP